MYLSQFAQYNPIAFIVASCILLCSSSSIEWAVNISLVRTLRISLIRSLSVLHFAYTNLYHTERIGRVKLLIYFHCYLSILFIFCAHILVVFFALIFHHSFVHITSFSYRKTNLLSLSTSYRFVCSFLSHSIRAVAIGVHRYDCAYTYAHSSAFLLAHTILSRMCEQIALLRPLLSLPKRSFKHLFCAR